MRSILPTLFVLLATLASIAAGRADSRAEAVCADKKAAPEQRIAACTSVIKARARASEQLALAYKHRGNAHLDAHAYVGAIADYTEALKVKPDFADAYYNRALARCQFTPCLKGAREDVDRAMALKLDAAYLTLRGWIHWRDGRGREAMRDFTAAIRMKPNHTDAYRKRAFVGARTGDLGRALDDYRRAVELDPNFADTRCDRADALSQAGLDDKALNEYAAAIALNPRFLEAFNNRALVHARHKNYALALDDLNTALRIAPYPTGFGNRASVYVDTKRFAEAIADYDRAIALRPTAAYFTWRAKARLKWGAAHFGRAKLDLASAILADADHGSAFFTRALILYREGDYTAAMRDLRLVKRMVPPAMIDYAKGLVLKATGRRAEGQAAIDRARREAPTIDEVMEDEGVTRDPSPPAAIEVAVSIRPADAALCEKAVASDFALRIADCTAAIKTRKNPSTLASAYLLRAQANMALGKRAEARPDFEEAIKLNPNEAFAYEGRADVRMQLAKDFAGAAADYARAVALKPMETRFWAGLCWTQTVMRRDLDEALRSCEHALKLDPGAPHLLAVRGFARLVRGEPAEAIADYDAALRSALPGTPGDPYALYGRGIAKQRRGDAVGSRQDIAAALAIEAAVRDEFKAWGVAL
jgi:tetratricopeptide (TPR) repeat protein